MRGSRVKVQRSPGFQLGRARAGSGSLRFGLSRLFVSLLAFLCSPLLGIDSGSMRGEDRENKPATVLEKDLSRIPIQFRGDHRSMLDRLSPRSLTGPI